MEGDDCAVCCEPLSSGTLCLPGCDHRLHVACALTLAQYDSRCPVCRALPTGVKARSPLQLLEVDGTYEPDDDDEEAEEADAQRRARRRYAAQRARTLRRRPELADLDMRLRQVRGSLSQECARAEDALNAACRAAWREDTNVLAHRRSVALLRRRERRLARRLYDALAQHIGPPTH